MRLLLLLSAVFAIAALARGADPFLVVHADPVLNRALTEMARQTPGVWEYDEMRRWRPAHAEAMWRFDACARTEGRWPMCGSGALEDFQDPFDARSIAERRRRSKLRAEGRHRHHRRARVEDLSLGAPPRRVGFGADANIVERHYADVLEALLKRGASAIVLKSSFSPTRALLRAAIYGLVNPHTKETPGLDAGVARSLYGVERGHRRAPFLYHDEPLLCRDGKPDTILRLLRKHQREQARMEAVVAALREAGVRVHEIDIDRDVMGARSQQEAVERVYGEGAGAMAANGSDPVPFRIPMDVVDRSCVDLLNRARLRLAIMEAEDSPGLIADIDRMLSDVERWRKDHAPRK